MKALIEVDPNRLVGVLNLAAMALADPQNKDAFLDDFESVVTARNEVKRWHKFPDEMPSEDSRYLVAWPTGLISIGWYEPESKEFTFFQNDPPSHWMELPWPPEEQECPS